MIEALANGLRESVQYVSPMMLNGTIGVLRQMKQDQLADVLIDYYVDQRKGEESLFDLKKSVFGGASPTSRFETASTKSMQER